MNRYLMYISYIGTRFRGIQRQICKADEKYVDRTTVQGCIEIALRGLKPANEITLLISSRTDAGVHALCSSVHVDLERKCGQLYDPDSITRLANKYLYRHYLPVRVIRTLHVPDTFHCRFCAKGRTYLYRIAVAKKSQRIDSESLRNLNFNQFIPVEEFERCYFIQDNTFSIDAVKQAAELIKGKHDFRSFMSVNQKGKKQEREAPYKSTIRAVDEILITPSKPVACDPDSKRANEIYDYWDITIQAKSFLYKQVRRIVGTLVAIGSGRITEKDVCEMLTIPSKFSWPHRAVVAPACGLYLVNVHYDENDLKFTTNTTEMSLQSELEKKRAALRATYTTVTHLDGSKTLESGNDVQKLSERSCGFVVDTKPDRIPACILDRGLYLGSQDCVDIENVKKYSITHILSVGIETPFVEDVDLICKYLPCLDLPETNLNEICSEANTFITESLSNNGRVLVHCNAGVSRSAAVVISYLMICERFTFDEAYNLVKTKRECIQPNSGFMKQLKTNTSFLST